MGDQRHDAKRMKRLDASRYDIVRETVLIVRSIAIVLVVFDYSSGDLNSEAQAESRTIVRLFPSRGGINRRQCSVVE